MTVGPGNQVTGLLLCKVAENRLAFPARQVSSVAPWRREAPAPHARAVFSLPAEKGRVLVATSGDTVAVDTIELFKEPLPLMAPPALIARVLGGSLAGFVTARQELWPVLQVAEFARFVASREVGR